MNLNCSTMAENKYDLLLVNTLTEKKIREQPWYKERLKTRYLKAKKPSDVNKNLQGSRWTFLVDGLDDFRDGLPPEVEGEMVVKGSKNVAPNIQGDSTAKFPNRISVNKGRFTKEEIAYYKTTPMEQQRRDHINEMEFGLLQHPLALYPHLEESMPPDVFEDVVDILDPEMNLDSDEEEDDEFQEEMTESFEEQQYQEEGSIQSKETSTGSKSSQESEEQKSKNPYRWLPRKEEQQKEDKKASKKRSESPSQDEHIKHVTKDFCDWVAGLGGESNNVEESTITSLFASGYETKPALSVPIHVVELTNVPPELRMSATVSQEDTPTKTLEQVEKTQKQLYGGYTPSWVKTKYGAWYLSPESWTKRAVDEPLQDPKTLKEKEMSESKKKSLDMDETLAPLHGSKSFKEFVEKKHTRMPEFLERVAEFQAQAEAEAAAAAVKTSIDKGRESVVSRGRSSAARSARSNRSAIETS